MENLVKQILGQLSDFRFQAWPQNWLLKLMSFIFALFLWYFVVGEDKVDMELLVPIEIVNLPRDLTISNQYKKQLEVAISGPRGIVRGLSKQHITRAVDLSKATAGKVVIRNEPDSIPFSRGIRVMRIQPANITFQLEHLISKDLPIQAVTKGELPEGLELGAITMTPKTVRATGPENILGREQVILTEPLDLSRLHQTVSLQTALDLKPELAELIGELDVTANLNIHQQMTRINVAGIIAEINHEGERTTYHLQPPTVQVEAEIPTLLLNQTEDPTVLFKARLEAAGLKPGRHELPVTVSGDANVKIINVTPNKLRLLISEPQPAKKQRLDEEVQAN